MLIIIHILKLEQFLKCKRFETSQMSRKASIPYISSPSLEVGRKSKLVVFDMEKEIGERSSYQIHWYVDSMHFGFSSQRFSSFDVITCPFPYQTFLFGDVGMAFECLERNFRRNIVEVTQGNIGSLPNVHWLTLLSNPVHNIPKDHFVVHYLPI